MGQTCRALWSARQLILGSLPICSGRTVGGGSRLGRAGTHRFALLVSVGDAVHRQNRSSRYNWAPPVCRTRSRLGPSWLSLWPASAAVIRRVKALARCAGMLRTAWQPSHVAGSCCGTVDSVTKEHHVPRNRRRLRGDRHDSVGPRRGSKTERSCRRHLLVGDGHADAGWRSATAAAYSPRLIYRGRLLRRRGFVDRDADGAGDGVGDRGRRVRDGLPTRRPPGASGPDAPVPPVGPAIRGPAVPPRTPRPQIAVGASVDVAAVGAVGGAVAAGHDAPVRWSSVGLPAGTGRRRGADAHGSFSSSTSWRLRSIRSHDGEQGTGGGDERPRVYGSRPRPRGLLDLVEVDVVGEAGHRDRHPGRQGRTVGPPVGVGVPEVGVPEVGAPEVGVPEVGVWRSARRAPRRSAPRRLASEGWRPGSGAPPGGWRPRGRVPEVGVPEVGVPEVGVPEVGARRLASRVGAEVSAPEVSAPGAPRSAPGGWRPGGWRPEVGAGAPAVTDEGGGVEHVHHPAA